MKTSEQKTLGFYIHIPFCKQKCRYCDFVSYPVDDSSTHMAYVLKVIYELRARRAMITGADEADSQNPGDWGDTVVDSIYFGGGTPSLIEAGFITEILDAIYATYNVAEDAEITIEVNPGTSHGKKLLRYRRSGINRVSIGVQSFNNDILAFLGRSHSMEDAVSCVVEARAAGFDNIGLDLIFAIPGQGFSDWSRDLSTALILKPDHVSFYSLQIEEGTPLFEDLKRGAFNEPADTMDRVMYRTAQNYLSEDGFCQYEISNSARPGRESRHNLKYWSMEPYVGFGVNAHSYFGGRRFANTSGLAAYLTAGSEKEMTVSIHENTLSDDMGEFVFLGLRRISGIELSRFNARFGKDFWEQYGKVTRKLIDRGLLEHEGDALRLTPDGRDLANTVFCEYV